MYNTNSFKLTNAPIFEGISPSKLFINKFRDSSASPKDFLSCIPQNITGDSKLSIEKSIKDIDYFYFKSKCPPVFAYKVEAENNLLKNIYFERTTVESLSFNSGVVYCDVKLFYKSENQDSASAYKYEYLEKLFSDFEPNIVINAAAKVGGILANNLRRTEFILNNYINNIHQ